MILTAGLVVLCMFAFIFSPSLKPQHLPVLLGMFAFGTIFYLLGQPSGKGSWFAVAGAIVGFVVVSFMPDIWGPAPAATTSVGKLSEEELQELMQKRQTANEFMGNVIRTGLMSIDQFIAQQQPTFLEQPPQMRQFYYQIFQGPYMNYLDQKGRAFGFAPAGNTRAEVREAVVRDWVMAKEADKLGIRVSNATITEYLKKASNQNLTDKEFIRLREETGLSEDELYDLLRYQIKVKQYYALLDPTHSFTNPLGSPASNLRVVPPEQLWEYYKRATIQQDMELVSIPVKDFESKVPDPSEGELAAFFEMYKNRFPRGVITRQEGWTEPPEVLSPEPAFGVPRKIKLAYFTVKIPSNDEIISPAVYQELVDYLKQKAEFEKQLESVLEDDLRKEVEANLKKLEDDRKPESKKLEKALRDFYWKSLENYPDPSQSLPLSGYDVPSPLSPGGPAVAQKPPKQDFPPAVAEKYRTFEDAMKDVADAYTFDRQQIARLENDRRISSLISKMSNLSGDYQREGEGHLTPQDVSDELVAYAKEQGFDKDSYTVPEHAWTPAEMTDRKIGLAVEVDINTNAGPGERRATAATNGATVVFQMFEQTRPEDLFQPYQAISRSEADTRYVFWKIEDHPAFVPEWNTLTEDERKEVTEAWKLFKARDLAKARAKEISDALTKYFAKKPEEGAEDRDMQKALDKLKLKQQSGDGLNVRFVPSFQWLMPPDPRSGMPPRLGMVVGVPKAGEQFMNAAFNEISYDPKTEEGGVGVLVNADGTDYYVGKVLRRQYGLAENLEGLRESFLRDTDSAPAMQTVAVLQNQQARELHDKWQQKFMEKYNISVTPPRER